MQSIFRKFLWLLALGALSHVSLEAQIIPQVSETFIDNSTGISQVAVDARTINGCERSVVAWDGTNPGLAWDDHCGNAGQLTLPPGITYLDVAIYEGAFFDHLALVFIIGGDVYVRGYSWQAGSYVQVPGSTHILSTMNNAQDCQMDSDDAGRAVITWMEISNNVERVIMARAYSMLFLFPNGPEFDISTNAIPAYMRSPAPPFTTVARPDVTIATYGQAFPPTVHFSYLVYDPDGNTHLFYQYEEFINVLSGTPAFPFVLQPAHTAPPLVSLGYPRISALTTDNTYSLEGQATVVFDEQDLTSGESRIYTLNGMIGGAILINVFGGEACTNQNPSITMTRCEEYVVAWEYDDLIGCGLPNLPAGTGADLIGLALDDLGFPLGSDYQILNTSFGTGGQYEYGPKLAGRFSQQMTSAYFDSNEDVYRKISPCSSSLPFFRTERPAATDLRLFPNPGTEQVRLVHAWEQAVDTHIEVVDVMGRTVAAVDLGLTDHVDWTYPAAHLAEGVYWVRLRMGERQEVRKWLKKE